MATRDDILAMVRPLEDDLSDAHSAVVQTPSKENCMRQAYLLWEHAGMLGEWSSPDYNQVLVKARDAFSAVAASGDLEALAMCVIITKRPLGDPVLADAFLRQAYALRGARNGQEVFADALIEYGIRDDLILADAFSLADAVIKRDPSNGRAYHVRGKVHQMRLKPKEAIKDYTEAHRLRPTDVDVLYDLTKLHSDLDNPLWSEYSGLRHAIRRIRCGL